MNLETQVAEKSEFKCCLFRLTLAIVGVTVNIRTYERDSNWRLSWTS